MGQSTHDISTAWRCRMEVLPTLTCHPAHLGPQNYGGLHANFKGPNTGMKIFQWIQGMAILHIFECVHCLSLKRDAL